MASNSVVCVPGPKTVSLVAGGVGSNATTSNQSRKIVSFPFSSASRLTQKSLSLGFSSFQCPTRKLSAVAKVAAEKSSKSAPAADAKSNGPSLEGKSEPEGSSVPNASSIAAFIGQVSDLVKLVDSRDIVELQLKQMDFEVTIRKKEALEQPAAASTAPVFTMHPPYPQAAFPTPPRTAPAAAPARSSALATAPSLPPSAKKSSSSNLPALKCPMAGTFYRSSAPGEPPFVKVGDKVQKGQVVCIVEAMKLMNEIEADQSGTITEILVEDGKPVSVDTPLFVIAA